MAKITDAELQGCLAREVETLRADLAQEREKNERLRVVARPFIKDARSRADFDHETWNPDAHVELTATIAECRELAAAAAAAQAQGEQSP